MENAEVRKKQTRESPSVARSFWDPFWLMREMFAWGQSRETAPLDVEETEDAYVCKVKLTLPGQADVAHAKAELENGELRLVVPKAAAAAASPEPAPPPREPPRAKGNRRRTADRKRRRGARGSTPRR